MKSVKPKSKQKMKLHKFIATGGKPSNKQTVQGVMPKKSK